MCVIQNTKNGAKSFLIYPGKQKIYPEKLNIDPRNVLPAAWNPLLTQLWHRAISLLSQHTKDLFLKPAASAGTDCSVPGNAKLLCGLGTSLCLLPFQDPGWQMLLFALLFFAVFPQQVIRFASNTTILKLPYVKGHSTLCFLFLSWVAVYKAIVSISTE